ncbi:hypothetical protein SBOR_0604 [Sclerotinia borealis F-4128]|uniref:YDG domain-containing protein n=1 Tax=Sclerotinia borealis (strain F-4128) TaxID=1432307 RepID=W9CSW4_SCLBF|nr:hypothetical protein SBOR_0604 [Sclerotinia borealis F-4128]
MSNQNPPIDIESVNQLNLPEPPTIKFEYQKDHMFRGLKLVKGHTVAMRTSWKDDERSVYDEGHNGQMIGDWWPWLICALRDRAHGSINAGICGKKGVGAVSIYMGSASKKGYIYDNIDNGNTIEYCGSEAGTPLMDLSFEKGTLIRVLRAANDKSDWAPSIGYRYDGLYKIVSKELIQVPEKDKELYRYKMVRDKNQKPLRAHARPTIEETDEFEAKRAWLGGASKK